MLDPVSLFRSDVAASPPGEMISRIRAIAEASHIAFRTLLNLHYAPERGLNYDNALKLSSYYTAKEARSAHA